MILLERIRKARRAKDKADETFVSTLRAAKPVHSWTELAEAAGMSKHGVRYIVNDEGKEGAGDE
jgi:hypothetical protein